MDRVYIDIETIPSQVQSIRDYVAQGVKPPATIKKQESIDKWYAESYDSAVENALEKTSFDGAMNHIICIGCALNDNQPITFYAKDIKDEPEILKAFYNFIECTDEYGTVFVGHNITQFDMRVIRQRSIVCGVKPRRLPFDAKPWDKNPYDTMIQWDSKNYTSQDKLALAFGLKPKDGIDGSMVYQYWKDKKHDEIAEYCKNDVLTVREIYKKICF